MNAEGRTGVLRSLMHAAGSPRFSQALTVLTLGTAFGTHLIRGLIGWPGLLGMLAVLLMLCSVSIAGQEDLRWRGILPISLITLVAWMAVSALLSAYTWTSLTSWFYTVAFVLLGLYAALARDLIQLIRATGDVLRALLALSLVVEVLSGIILDTPFRFLGVSGTIAQLGPIQGIFGTRNMLGFVGGIALITFATEWRTQSVTRRTAVASVFLAVVVLLLARSPVTLIATVAVLAAGAALLALRRAPRTAHRMLQASLGGVLLIIAGAAWLLRAPILAFLNATSEIEYRTTLWDRMFVWAEFHQVEGWGWLGLWRSNVFPYSLLSSGDRHYGSGLNAFFDAWLQIGIVGALILLATGITAFVRAWLVASEKRIVAYVWPALILVLIGVTSLAESYLLFESGLLVFVACAVTAARARSWRQRLGDPG